MNNKIIYVDFTTNRRKNDKLTFLSRIRNFIKKLFNDDNSSNPKSNKKVIHYNRDIS